MEDFNQNLNIQPQPQPQPQPQVQPQPEPEPTPAYTPPAYTPPTYTPSAQPNFDYETKSSPLSMIVLVIICIVLLASNIYFGMEYFSANGRANKLSSTKAQNTKIVALENLFISKVLKTQGAVSYQDRLNLQSAVVNLNDNGIMGDWNTFLASTTQDQAQQSVLVLLSDFTNKIDK